MEGVDGVADVVEDGTADETGALTVDEVIGGVDEATGVVVEDTAVEEAAEVVEETGASEYTFNLSGPPQNSELFPAQVIAQPDIAGCPPFW